ncbi:MAG TPA: hypothetical protein VGB70_01460 [Allosphingosinicella sp.]|jgi:hypothetical protein
MEQAYWLGRIRSSSQMVKRAASSEARMAHLELTGRYSIQAAVASPRAARKAAPARLSLRAPGAETDVDAVFGGVAYYERLEAGARWLAGKAASFIERDQHLGAAKRYARLRIDAASSRRVLFA